MNPLYVNAIETRFRWLRHCDHPEQWATEGSTGTKITASSLETSKRWLSRGETYFMDTHFIQLVSHTQQIVPTQLRFESRWLISPEGCLFFENPLQLAREAVIDSTGIVINNFVDALCWATNPATQEILVGLFYAIPHSTVFDFLAGYRLSEGLSLAEISIDDTEEAGSRAVMQSGAKWIYCCLYLMAQKLTSRIRYPTDRALRRRVERQRQIAPSYVDIITLRRKQEARERDIDGQKIDWQWRWAVRGHWREQWHPHLKIHKSVFIESYIKGPEDKPVKSPTIKLFTAVR